MNRLEANVSFFGVNISFLNLKDSSEHQSKLVIGIRKDDPEYDSFSPLEWACNCVIFYNVQCSLLLEN